MNRSRAPQPGQLDFDGQVVPARRQRRRLFDGATYEPKADEQRLAHQLVAVRNVMLDGHEHTLADLANRTHASEASVSARLRDLRKSRFGGYTVIRRRIAGGLYGYTLRPT